MTYIPRRDVTDVIPNKFEAIRVLALECRRLNDEMRLREETTERKITSIAFERLKQGALRYYDAREKREQERSEAMLNAAELLLDLESIDVADLEDDDTLLDATTGLEIDDDVDTADDIDAEGGIEDLVDELDRDDDAALLDAEDAEDADGEVDAAEESARE